MGGDEDSTFYHILFFSSPVFCLSSGRFAVQAAASLPNEARIIAPFITRVYLRDMNSFVGPFAVNNQSAMITGKAGFLQRGHWPPVSVRRPRSMLFGNSLSPPLCGQRLFDPRPHLFRRYEATRDLTTKSISIRTDAIERCPARKIAESVAVVPILR